MKKIVLYWILIPLCISLIPVLFLGASRGGIALSPLIIVLSLVLGFVGAAAHVVVYAFWKGDRKKQGLAIAFAVASSLFVAWFVSSWLRCSLSPEYAQSRVESYIESNEGYELQYLGEIVFDQEQCLCTFVYSSPVEKMRFIVSGTGNLHFSRE